MKTIAAVYLPDYTEGSSASFDAWISRLPDLGKVLIMADDRNQKAVTSHYRELPVEMAFAFRDSWKLSDVLDEICGEADGYDAVILAWGDCPFYNDALTSRLYGQHAAYSAEYSFADGWPLGLVPEIAAPGTLNILRKLGEQKKDLSSVKYGRDSLFNLMKADINSFEVETLISPVDYRMYRLEFINSTKRGKLLCQRLGALSGLAEQDYGKADALELCGSAVKDPEMLHTLPSFFSIQIAEKCTGKCIYCPYPAAYKAAHGVLPSEDEGCRLMEAGDFSALIDRIHDFSGDAVIALSLWGEPLYHPELASFIGKVLEYPSLSVLVETSGISVDGGLVSKIKEISDRSPSRTGRYPPVMWIVSLDAVTEETYGVLHPGSIQSLKTASGCAGVLEAAFPGAVYVQMVRTEYNEKELEPFFRGHENRIIQKYDWFSGSLPQFKPADLSPVVRNVCRHLRCDMSILVDGSVPFCRECLFGECMGNAFTDSLDNIWRKGLPAVKAHIDGNYPEICRNCDEYYTCNF